LCSEDVEFGHRLGKKYRAVWDSENGVLHHFRPSPWKYFKQQFNYTRTGPALIFGSPGTLAGKSLHDKTNYFEIALSSLAILEIALSPLLLSFFPAEAVLSFPLTMVLGLLLLNLPFFYFLLRKQGLLFAFEAVPIVVARDFAWAFGLAFGFFQFLLGGFK